MTPRWCNALLRALAPDDQVDGVLGDLEEAHRRRARERGRVTAYLLTVVETLDVAFALLRERYRLGFSSLDFKLGLRMLIRAPGISVLGTAALAFAIFVGAGTFEFIKQTVAPTLPLPDGDRIVGIRVWSTETRRQEGRMSWDFTRWVDEVRSIENIGAWDTQRRNLVVGESLGTLVTFAEISASGFRVAGVPPLMGRWLQDEDQEPDAEPTVVLGYDVWRDKLAADPEVIGRIVQVGDQATTVVGVMPEGFRFPMSHEAWIPLPASLAGYGPLEGPTLEVFGRLASGVDRKEASTELAGLAAQAAAEHPTTHVRLQAEVVPFHRLILDIPPNVRAVAATLFVGTNLPVLLFVILVGGNVALLMFARVAARESDLVVRSALGASRRRIITQLFVEGLVLTTLAAVIGLSLVGYGMRAGYYIVEAEIMNGTPLPFWFRPSLSTSTIVYTALVTLLAAAVVGVLPGLKATKELRGQLQRTSAGGGGYGFGGIWTGIIIAQIAVTCVAPIFTIVVWEQDKREHARVELAIPVEDYLGARLNMDQPRGLAEDPEAAQAAFQKRYRETLDELALRLRADPRVAGVAYSQRMPRQYHPWNQIEVEGPAAEPRDERGHRLAQALVEPDFFPSMGVEILEGRDFDSGDLEEGERNVIVNEAFIRRILGGRNPIGRRFRYLANEAFRDPDQEPGPWHVIVGVVPDLGVASGYGPQGVYHVMRPADLMPVHVVAHVPGDAETFAATLQSTAFDVTPALRVSNVRTLGRVTDASKAFYRFWFTLLIVLTSVALVLSLGGIYAVMSFTVTQRTREIGVRVALGSTRTGVLASILRRPMLQVAAGVVTGVGLMVTMIITGGENLRLQDFGWAAIYSVVMWLVCMTAVIVPVRRVLRLEIRDALGVEG